MMSPDDPALQDLLYASDLGAQAEEAELNADSGVSKETAADSSPAAPETPLTDAACHWSEQTPEGRAERTPADLSFQETMACSGCGKQVSDRVFLLAAGGVWHSPCLRCSQCQCELQTHPSLYWRDGNIYCLQDYRRMFGGGQCARCSQPIPASALVMRSGDLTFHPHCFSCQDCDLKLIPGNLYCIQGQNIYCQSHYHDNSSVTRTHDLPAEPNTRNALNQAPGEGEESVSSPEPRLDDSGEVGRSHRRIKRMRTCFQSEQLRALEMYFAQKQNPDGKDWTCLAQRTGLPKRVLQVWFQNARAKLRRSLSSEESHVNSPSALQRPVTMPTTSPPPTCSTLDQSGSFPTSTIDHLQLSLLTSPLNDSPPFNLHNFYLDYLSQNAPGCVSSLEDFGEEGGTEGEADAEKNLGPHYC